MAEQKGTKEINTDFAVIGAGPGGYSAAFRAADLGLRTLIIEKHERLGGVCLNVGCIPSKTLLHAAQVIREAADAQAYGVTFSAPSIDIAAMRDRRESVVATLTGGLKKLAKARNVTVMQGEAVFSSPKVLKVTSADGSVTDVHFAHALLAVGSRPARIPGIDYDDPRIWDSTAALALREVPKRLTVIGGGIIGLEMAAVYDALGSAVTVVEMTDQLIPAADADIVRPLYQVLKKRYAGLYVSTKVEKVEQEKDVIRLYLSGKKAPEMVEADAVLVSVGRTPNTEHLGTDELGIQRTLRGFFTVDSQMRTAVPHIFAVGDAAGNPMLAHKAVHEGKTAAEAAAGLPASFSPLTIPSVAYTDPEVAWMGLTEREAQEQGREFTKGVFPWSASGRALSSDSARGISKVLFDKETGRIIGAGITGRNAGELIAEAVLALEMGADAEDISRTVHAHPTLSETFSGAAEMVHGSITDLLPPKK